LRGIGTQKKPDLALDLFHKAAAKEYAEAHSKQIDSKNQIIKNWAHLSYLWKRKRK
jgi:hypothetical protein